MSGLCAAVGCSNRSVGQHHAPGRPMGPDGVYILKQWLQNVKREAFTPTGHHILCSDHFIDDCLETGMEVQSSLTWPLNSGRAREAEWSPRLFRGGTQEVPASQWTPVNAMVATVLNMLKTLAEVCDRSKVAERRHKDWCGRRLNA